MITGSGLRCERVHGRDWAGKFRVSAIGDSIRRRLPTTFPTHPFPLSLIPPTRALFLHPKPYKPSYTTPVALFAIVLHIPPPLSLVPLRFLIGLSGRHQAVSFFFYVSASVSKVFKD